MTLTQRIGRILSALFSILAVVLIVMLGEDGIKLVCLLLSLSLIVQGLRRIAFYFSMARHMVDGRSALYIGVIVLDFGVLPCPSHRTNSCSSFCTFSVPMLFTGRWTSCARGKHKNSGRRHGAGISLRDSLISP